MNQNRITAAINTLFQWRGEMHQFLLNPMWFLWKINNNREYTQPQKLILINDSIAIAYKANVGIGQILHRS